MAPVVIRPLEAEDAAAALHDALHPGGKEQPSISARYICVGQEIQLGDEVGGDGTALDASALHGVLRRRRDAASPVPGAPATHAGRRPPWARHAPGGRQAHRHRLRRECLLACAATRPHEQQPPASLIRLALNFAEQVVERVDKLVLVKPLKTRYQAAQGDVVVGRVTEVRGPSPQY